MPDFRYSVERKIERPWDLVEYLDHQIASGRITQAAATDEFSMLMLRGLKMSLFQGHESAPRVWDRIVSRESSDGEFETYAGVGTPVGVAIVEEGEPYPEGRFTTDRAIIVNKKHGYRLAITRELLRRDRTGKVRGIASGMGIDHQNSKDKEYAAMLNAGTSFPIYDGNNFLSVNHPNLTGGAAVLANDNTLALGAISVANLETMRQSVAGWLDYNNEPLAAGLDILLVAPNQFEDAVRFVTSSGHPVATFSSGVTNVNARTYGEVVQWVRLTATTWYAKTMVPGVVYQEEVALTFEQEASNSGDNFLRDIYQTKTSESYGTGVRDWRAIVKGN